MSHFTISKLARAGKPATFIHRNTYQLFTIYFYGEAVSFLSDFVYTLLRDNCNVRFTIDNSLSYIFTAKPFSLQLNSLQKQRHIFTYTNFRKTLIVFTKPSMAKPFLSFSFFQTQIEKPSYILSYPCIQRVARVRLPKAGVLWVMLCPVVILNDIL